MTGLCSLDGRLVARAHRDACDVVVVGSGPAGAVAAKVMAERGAKVVVIEEGNHVTPEQFHESGLRAMASLYREMGTSLTAGNAPMPYLQGRVVGGTSVVNGAISWRFPREVAEAWIRDDPALGEAIPYERIAEVEAVIEARLNVHPTEANVAGRKNLLLGKGADALGKEHRPIRRNVQGCVGAGRCLQGCPHGHKLSMDRSYLPDAVALGARIVAGARVDRVLVERGRAVGVKGTMASGALFDVRASRAVVVAASAIQSPCLLMKSGVLHGPVGQGLMAHPGVSVTGRFAEPVRAWEGATQGHEVTGYRGEGLKLEALGFDRSLLASRIPGVGAGFARRLAEIDRYAVWGAAVRAQARGRVLPWFGSKAIVLYSLGDEDVARVRRGVEVLGEAMLAAGAVEVYTGVQGFDGVVTDKAVMKRFSAEGPRRAGDYAMSMTHLFGTAKMGSNPETSVVRPDFRHHAVEGLYVADSSVFPTSLGVNPQIAIMALAHLCGERVVE